MTKDSIIIQQIDVNPDKVNSRFKESAFSYDSLDVVVVRNGKIEQKDFQKQKVRKKGDKVRVNVVKTYVERNGMG